MNVESIIQKEGIPQEIIERVEHLPVNDNVKVDTLLILSGFKQATEIEMGKQWAPNEISHMLSEDEIVLCRKSLEEIGLKTIEPMREKHDARVVTEGEEAPYTEYGKDVALFCVAKDKMSAEQLKQAVQTDDDRVYGTLSGFPATAIDAYIANENKSGSENDEPLIISREELPKEVREQDFMAFAEFMFSKDYWREELETVKRWATQIQQADPMLYARIVASYRSMIRQ